MKQSGAAAINDLDMFDAYERQTTKLLSASTNLDQYVTTIRNQQRNFSKHDAEFMQRLMSDPTITIKPADKNLGMVLVDTHWYENELDRMLSDKVTYQLIHKDTIGTATTTVAEIQTKLLEKLCELADNSKDALTDWDAQHHTDLAGRLVTFIKRQITAENCAIPSIYLLIKVHKASGLCGRPIVPATRWLTTPPSVLVDHLLQQIFREKNVEHIVKDTKSLVHELEHLQLPTDSGVFVTADIASLYTNIDTEMGLRLVRKFLTEQNTPPRITELIMSLLTFVMTNSYLQFNGKTYLQIDGTAMGTACAPIYANIVVYMMEKKVIEDMSASIYLYRRFLDDVFAYLEPSAVDTFKTRMNSLDPKLRFEFVDHETEASFLDLRIHKGKRFSLLQIFDLSVHQKKMNLYLYIPFPSFHTEATRKSFIQTELMRYIRNSSDEDDFNQLRDIFYIRLRDRGYPDLFLEPIFTSIFYADRRFFLWPSKELHLHPDIDKLPPQSAGLQKKYKRYLESRSTTHSQTGTQLPSPAPPVFIIPYSPLSAVMPTKKLLMENWSIIHDAFGYHVPAPIIAYQGSPSLVGTLVHSRAKQMELLRSSQSELESAATQPSIDA